MARDRADLGFPDVAPGDVLDDWRSSVVDVARDTRVAESAGGIVGYAIVRPEGSYGVTHPRHERRGIGVELLRWAEARERERGERPHRQWFASTNESARELVVGAGYHRIRSYFRMLRDLTEGVTAVAPPEGITVRSLDMTADAQHLHEVDDRAFAALPDYRPEPLDEFIDKHLSAHDLDPGCSRVAICAGQIVGFLLARRWESDRAGFVDILAVHPDHQGKGLTSRG